MSAIYGIAAGSRLGPRIDSDLPGMSAALRPRGPDDDMRWVNAAERIALGSRFLRTRIGEHSPGILFNEDRTLMMVCDGHVFDPVSLRSRLLDKGHTFRQRHSCELLLHLYEDEGVAGWARADGQFAVALWDVRAKRLVLGRDGLGVRPLYYWASADGIVFASEIKAILEHSRVPRAVDETAVADFLTYTSVPGPRTLFRNIHKVPAGSAVTCAIDGTVRIERYWDLLRNPIPESADERFYVDRVRSLHHAAVARVGRPAAFASRSATPYGSTFEASAKRSTLRRNSGTSSWLPRKRTRSATPRSIAS